MYFAKTNPVESIKEHTDNVLLEYQRLKKIYENEINNIIGSEKKDEFWKLLYKACFYHDFGKYNDEFQNKLKKKLGLKYSDTNNDEIYHNFLSLALITKDDRKAISNEIKTIFYQAIAYHHERGVKISLIEEAEYRNYIKVFLAEKINDINTDFQINLEKVNTLYLSSIEDKKRIKDSDANYNFYVMLKGLLHRLDHSASAHINVEEQITKSIGMCTEEYFRRNKWDKRKPQEFAIENKDRNIVLIASTGIGKTETALFWIDNSKAFFTLPLRVSLNALYSRVKDDIKYDSVGLLHSTALDYMIEERLNKGAKNYSDVEEVYGESKLLSKKLCFSTIDQIFKFPFKYLGYEKILATLAYSKIVIDEIQAYSPEIAATILIGIEQLYRIGGKFMIMTATMPKIYKDKLKEFNIEFQEKKYLSTKVRHKISLKNNEILSAINDIERLGKNNKVLVIVNTVNKAKECFNMLDKKGINVKLLHSMFINRDRAEKEREIKDFTNVENTESGIWVTTQLVEASLDVDFDFLFTEMSPLDSLFQRFGRCYRKRDYNLNIPNIYIFTKGVSGVDYIYDKDIFNLSISLLSSYDNSLISEENKVDLVDKLYSKEMIENTNYYKKFNSTYKLLRDLVSFSMSDKEAQKILRKIDSVTVIPKRIYDENIDLFMQLKGESRKDNIRKINLLTVNIPKIKIYSGKNANSDLELHLIDNLNGIYYINSKYSEEYGLNLDDLEEPFI